MRSVIPVSPVLQWSKSSQAYEAIGTVNYEFATLSDYRRQIPPPAAPPRFVVEKGEDDLEIVINAPLKAVYQTLINVDKRPEWLDGVDTINREMTSERIGMRHNCVFHGLKLINTAVFRDFHEDHALYSEKVDDTRDQADSPGPLRDGSPRQRQHAAQIQRELDGRSTPGAKQTRHDGWAGLEFRAPQERVRKTSGLTGAAAAGVEL